MERKSNYPASKLSITGTLEKSRVSDTQKRMRERSLTRRLESSCARRLKRTTESDSEDEVEKTVDNKTQPSEKLLFVLTFGNKFDLSKRLLAKVPFQCTGCVQWTLF